MKRTGLAKHYALRGRYEEGGDKIVSKCACYTRRLSKSSKARPDL